MAPCAKFVHGVFVRARAPRHAHLIAFAHSLDCRQIILVRCSTRVCVRTRGAELFSIENHLALWITVCVNSAERCGAAQAEKKK
jgi:hypothetical protein